MTGPKVCPACGNSYGADSLFCPLDRTPLIRPDDAALLQGTVVAGRYLLSDLIGSGGMGDVYKAQDVRLQRPAAVKLLRASLSADLDALRRFSREGMNASHINSPHVVQVYDAGETASGIPYLAMEFVPGKSLGRVLADEGSLGPARAAELIRQIAAGLDAAHRLGVVHRDLKPDNILVANAGTPDETAKVVDFGISRVLHDKSQKVTKTGFVAGTYEFMSPEQVLGGELDQRSDLYALGLIAFLLLTGKLPFPGATPEHSMLMRLTEPPRSLGTVCAGADWPPALQGVLDRVLAREPEARFSTAGEFAAAFGRAVVGSASLARPDVTPRRRVPRLAAAIAAAVVLGVGLVLGSRRYESRVEPISTPPPDSAESGELGGPPPDAVGHPGTGSPVDSSHDAPPSSAPGATLPADSSVTHHAPAGGASRPPVPKRPPSPPPPVTPATASLLLDPFASILHAKLPVDSARLALSVLDSILPRLGTRRDSVDAGIYRAEALALAGEDERACQVLDGLWPRASDLQRRKIGLWVDRDLCPHADWRQS
jgi:serine/threonine protein kinase